VAFYTDRDVVKTAFPSGTWERGQCVEIVEPSWTTLSSPRNYDYQSKYYKI